MTSSRPGRAAILSGAGVLLAAAGLMAAPDAQATGNCKDYSPGGYPIGICINDRNIPGATNAYPDYYVNGAVPANCRITVEIWDGFKRRFGPVFQDSNSCTKGHHPSSGSWCVSSWDPAEYGDSVTVHAYFRLYSGSRQINDTSTNSGPLTVNYEPTAHC
ncbi:hypothetical protein ABZ915_46245 [Streptomyces sp. NPDC046915]|uniref:hypothetical protein n=1 Tax=Streptomyces sp. NPDC046915 TaxID=3155257 RepID=UPI0033F65272